MGIANFTQINGAIVEVSVIPGTPVNPEDPVFLMRPAPENIGDTGSIGVVVVDHSCLMHKYYRGQMCRKRHGTLRMANVHPTDDEVRAVVQSEIDEIMATTPAGYTIYIVYDGKPTKHKVRKQPYTLLDSVLGSDGYTGDGESPTCTFESLGDLEAVYTGSAERVLTRDVLMAYVATVIDMNWSQVKSLVLRFAKYRGCAEQTRIWESVWADVPWKSRHKAALVDALVAGTPPPGKRIRETLEEMIEPGVVTFVEAKHEADYEIASITMDHVERKLPVIIISNDSDTTLLALGARHWATRGGVVVQDAMIFWTKAYMAMRGTYRILRDEGKIRKLKRYILTFLADPEHADLLPLVGPEYELLDRHLWCVLAIVAALFYNKSDYHKGTPKRGPVATIRMILEGDIETELFQHSLDARALRMWFPSLLRIAQYFRNEIVEISDEVVATISEQIAVPVQTTKRRRRRRKGLGWTPKWIEAAIKEQEAR